MSETSSNIQTNKVAVVIKDLRARFVGVGLKPCRNRSNFKLWDFNDGKPNLLSQHQPQVGAIFACGFSPSVPYLIAAAGSKGMVAVWDIMSEPSVREAHGKTLEQYYRVK